MNGLGQIAKAILTASQTVDQRAVQGSTKAVQTGAFGSDNAALMPAFAEYRRQMAVEGRRPLPFPQWKIINRNINS